MKLGEAIRDFFDTRPRHPNPDVDELLKYQAQAQACEDGECKNLDARREGDGIMRCNACSIRHGLEEIRRLEKKLEEKRRPA